MKPLPFALLATVVGGAALAAGFWLRAGIAPASAPAVVQVAKPQTEQGAVISRPAFWLSDVDGKRRGIDEWDGKLVVMNFWATWCPPCLHEIPVFIALQERYGDQGVQFLGVAIDEADKVQTFAEQVGMNYPTLHGQLDAIEVMTAYGNASGGLPYTVLIDRDGQLVARHPGILDEADAVALIEAHL